MLLREVAYVPVTLARQYGGRAGLRRFQVRRLNELLTYAYARVPHYRSRGGPPEPLTTLADVARVPLLTKATLRATANTDFLADGVDNGRCATWVTSGTTGHRISGWHDMDAHDYHMAACVRRFFATRRYRPTDRLAHLKPFPMPRRVVERFGLFRRHVILTTAAPRAWVEDLLRYRPHVLIGYPTHLRELLRTLTPDELSRLRRGLRLLMTESELLVPSVRARLEQGFGVPVRDEYSAYETLNIYFECHRGGRHVAEDRVFVEVVDEDGNTVPDGVEGQVVVTAFGERAMPLIRYVLGDLGCIDPDPCPCGRRFRTMRLTRGRISDAIVLADGTRIFADLFFVVSEFEPGVADTYVVQDAAGTIHVYVVPDGTVGANELLANARRRLLAQVAIDLPLKVRLADRIPSTPGGKGQFLVSEYVPAISVSESSRP